MIESRKYTNRDLKMVMGWFKSRNINFKPSMLPKTAFIVPNVAAGFLIKTDTKSCILEPFIANPKAAIKERDGALDIIMGDLIIEAKTLGFTHIFGFASHARMVSRAINWGFVKVEDSVTVVKEL